jgi:hypothetical protein
MAESIEAWYAIGKKENQMAMRTQPALDEFELKENEVVHKPTNATWSAYPNEAGKPGRCW